MRARPIRLAVTLLAAATLSLRASGEPQTIQFWHSMSGSLETRLTNIVNKFHAEQNDVRVNLVLKGSYTDALNGLVAAYRGGKQPHLTQVFEVGTQSMMMSGAILPVEDIFRANSIELNKKDFLEPVANYYSSASGKLMSMPFNSSTPIVYYDKDILADLHITKIPETWEEMFAVSHEIHEKSGGKTCGLVFGWQSWTLIENFSAINDLPIANPENGFLGLDVKMNLTNPDLLKHIGRVADAVHKKEFLFEGRGSEAPGVAFLARKCAFLVDSSSSIGSFNKTAKFKWGTTFQPYLTGRKPANSLIGGASLWVVKGHPDNEYKAVALFLKFLTKPEIQAEWHQGTGYLPITYSAYKLSAAQGFYKEQPAQETGVKQLLRGPVSTNSRGIRLGNFSQIREVIEESLEKIWEGRMTAAQGLKEANERSDMVLARFAELRQGNEKIARGAQK